MIRSLLGSSIASATLVLSLGTTPALAAGHGLTQAPPPAPYKAVSSLVKLPDFVPGLGQLFVDPATLPAGPFLGYDHKGRIVTTTYMIPLSMMKSDMNLNDLKAPGGKVDHVDMIYNAGHPGVAEPHIHVVLWHVPANQENRAAK